MTVRTFWCLPILAFCAALALALITPQSGASAQQDDTPAGPNAVQREVLQDLVVTLRDEEARQALIERIEALIAAREGTEGETKPPKPESFAGRLLAAATTRMRGATKQLSSIAESFQRIPQILGHLWDQAQSPAVLSKWGKIALKIGAVFFAGLLAEWIAKSLLARAPKRSKDEDARFLIRLLSSLGRAFRDLIPVAAFTLAAYAILSVVEPRPVTRLLSLAVINANVSVRVVLALSRFTLAPDRRESRLLPLGDETAAYGYIWIRRLVSVGVYGFFLAEAALLLGVSQRGYDLLLKLIGLSLTSIAIVLVLRNRASVATWIRDAGTNEKSEPGRSLAALLAQVAAVWHIIAVTFLTVLFGVWALDVPGGFDYLARAAGLSLLVAVLAIGLNRAIAAALGHGSAVSQGLADRFPFLEARLNRYLPALRSLLKVAIYGVAAMLVLQFWGAGTMEWMTSETGTRVLANLLAIALIATGALLFWEFVSAFIERTLERRTTASTSPRSARLLTLLPLLRNAIRVVLVVMVALIVLSQIGIDIGPLLAGAGVVGLAVGFGAQALVRDIITGAFILIEDSLAVGDWVEVGSHSGTVEAMTIRTVTLRDLYGTVHIIPFSEVTSVLNYNRAFGYSVLEVGVAYRENLDEVIAVLEEIGRELSQDQTFGPSLLGSLEIAGVNNLAESAVEIRVSVKTRPMKQWGVRRELLKRIKKTFDERGIEIPFPHRTLYFGIDKSGEAPPVPIAPQNAQS